MSDNKLNEDAYIALELKKTFSTFFYFALDLIKKISPNNDYLKIAVVNMQIALELFLKYYFVNMGKLDDIVIKKQGDRVKFKDFSDVLNYYFSQNTWSYVRKKELNTILEIRNSVVHNGLKGGWDEELATILIQCVFFIQGTMRAWLGESLFEVQFEESELSKNEYWKRGVEEFADKLVKDREVKVLPCPLCNAYAMIPAELFPIDINLWNNDVLQCLCCFQYLDMELFFDLIDCYICGEKSYLIDKQNEQTRNLYPGKCLECDVTTLVRKCSGCGRFYHPNKHEIQRGEKFYCSSECF